MRTWSNFLNVIQHWVSDTSAAVKVVFTGTTASDGSDAGLVVAEFAGEYLSTELLTLSATSQALASIPATATKAYIQIQGGTITEYAYISLDGSAATTSDMILRNIEEDAAAGIDVGNILSDIRLLGTANASTAIIVYST